MLGPNDYQQETALTANHFLDEYNGKPTLEKIQQIINQKRATGDLDKRISVSIEWALDMLDHFTTQSGFTYQMARDAPKKLYAMEQNMIKAQATTQLEKGKAQDLLVENTMMADRLEKMEAEYAQKEAILKRKLAQKNIIKLPFKKVNSFLMFSDINTKKDTDVFSVQIDDNGNMVRIFNQ